MTNVLISFYSRDGSTEQLALAVAEGVKSKGGSVRLRRAREFVDPSVMAAVPGWSESASQMNKAYEAPTPEDAEWALLSSGHQRNLD